MTPGTRLSVGAIVGGILGAMLAGPLGAAIGIAAGAGTAHATAGTPSAAHQSTFGIAMTSTADPSQLRALAKKMDPVGLGAPLRARASLREQPDPLHREGLRVAASSKNPDDVRAASLAFKRKGAQASAEMLRDYSRGLRAIERSRS